MKVCIQCGTTGKYGANFVLCVGEREYRVHKFCGEKLRAQAPEGASVQLVPFWELRLAKVYAKELPDWERVRAFWEEKFDSAHEGRKGSA